MELLWGWWGVYGGDRKAMGLRGVCGGNGKAMGLEGSMGLWGQLWGWGGGDNKKSCSGAGGGYGAVGGLLWGWGRGGESHLGFYWGRAHIGGVPMGAFRGL